MVGAHSTSLWCERSRADRFNYDTARGNREAASLDLQPEEVQSGTTLTPLHLRKVSRRRHTQVSAREVGRLVGDSLCTTRLPPKRRASGDGLMSLQMQHTPQKILGWRAKPSKELHRSVRPRCVFGRALGTTKKAPIA